MAVTHKDIGQLTQKTTLDGSEEVPVSSTQKTTFTKIKDWIMGNVTSALIRDIINNGETTNGLKHIFPTKVAVHPNGGVSGGFDEGIRVGNAPSGYSLLALGVDKTSANAGLNSDGKQWNIIKTPAGELIITHDSSLNTGLRLVKNGDIYWKNQKLNLVRATPAVSGYLHFNDFREFAREAHSAQIQLSRELYLRGEFFDLASLLGNEYPEFDSNDMWTGHSFFLKTLKFYEAMATFTFRLEKGEGAISLQIEEPGKGIIKRVTSYMNANYMTMSISCITNGDIEVTLSIIMDSSLQVTLLPQECWFAVHEIK